jgi:hypothetical protein
MLQRDGEVMMVMMVLVMMMMIPMKPISMMVTMAMIPPSPPGGNFPGRFLLAGELYLSLCFPPHTVLCFRGDDIREGKLTEVGQGRHTTWPCGQAWPAPKGGVGPWWPTSASPSGFLRHLAK